MPPYMLDPLSTVQEAGNRQAPAGGQHLHAPLVAERRVQVQQRQSARRQSVQRLLRRRRYRVEGRQGPAGLGVLQLPVSLRQTLTVTCSASCVVRQLALYACRECLSAVRLISTLSPHKAEPCVDAQQKSQHLGLHKISIKKKRSKTAGAAQMTGQKRARLHREHLCLQLDQQRQQPHAFPRVQRQQRPRVYTPSPTEATEAGAAAQYPQLVFRPPRAAVGGLADGRGRRRAGAGRLLTAVPAVHELLDEVHLQVAVRQQQLRPGVRHSKRFSISFSRYRDTKLQGVNLVSIMPQGNNCKPVKRCADASILLVYSSRLQCTA